VKDRFLKYGTHLARGLVFLAENKIAHLDIKTDNLLISSHDSLVITDFGVAGKLQDDWKVNTAFTIGGNQLHLAPEVMNARLQHQKFYPCEFQFSWEVGMILFEMLSGGEFPFPVYGLTYPCTITRVSLEKIPQMYQGLLSGLLCCVPGRMSIFDAEAMFGV
jgi:serine/threonine protein kinase